MRRFLNMALCLFIGASMVSCDSDDDNKIITPEVTLKEVVGIYDAQMTATVKEVEQDPVDVELTAKEVEGEFIIDIPEFPVSGLITAIVGEDLAQGIIDLVGETVAYNGKIVFEKTFKVENDVIKGKLTFEPLILVIEGMDDIEIAIETPKDVAYDVKEKKLVFEMDVESVNMGETAIPEIDVNMDFAAVKKAKNY